MYSFFFEKAVCPEQETDRTEAWWWQETEVVNVNDTLVNVPRDFQSSKIFHQGSFD